MSRHSYRPQIRQYSPHEVTGTLRLSCSEKELSLFPCLFFSQFVISQAIPMYNYPNFLNLFVNLLFIPICFAYIIPVAKYGWFQNAITQEQLDMPKKPFIVMGALDCLATSMQVFASVYLWIAPIVDQQLQDHSDQNHLQIHVQSYLHQFLQLSLHHSCR